MNTQATPAFIPGLAILKEVALQEVSSVKYNDEKLTTEQFAKNKNVLANQAAGTLNLIGGGVKLCINPPTSELDRSLLLEQCKHITVQFQQQNAKIPVPDQGTRFSIADMASSHQMKLTMLQDHLISVLLNMQKTDAKLAAGIQEVAVSLAEQSADHTRAAGKAAASQAITSGAIGISGAAFGVGKAGQSYKQGKFGISQQRESLNFQDQAKTLNSALHKSPLNGNMNQAQLQADRTVIANGSVQPMEYRASMAGIQASAHQNKAAKLNTHAMASTQVGNMGGQIAGSPFQVEQANETASATLSDNNKQVTDNTRGKVDENKQRLQQLLQQLMMMINSTLSEQANTSGAIASTRA
ncbi:hypothetical protein [Serratia marcescens]|uniref:hypothetical protein n=1 Tax=Serratia marcescens TaxID=615 RepID=UPI00148DD655|nr:hypothetical protein [Serratia marcescens]QJU42313.1 hypothetical protein HMI62_24715 [Serratia marcescens]